jgi:hypothetical protein
MLLFSRWLASLRAVVVSSATFVYAGPLLPCSTCTVSRSSCEERETHITCEPPIDRFHIQHYHSIPFQLPTRCIDIPQPISTLFSRAKPRQRSQSLRPRKAHGDPRLSRHSALRLTYLHIFIMAAMNTSTAPSTVQGSKPAAPANGNVIKRYNHTTISNPPSRPQHSLHTLTVSNPSSWAS